MHRCGTVGDTDHRDGQAQQSLQHGQAFPADLFPDQGFEDFSKAVAVDGYSVNYDPAQVLKDNVLVAYAQVDGNPLSADDGNFRMVLPDEEGKLNVRMLTELHIIQ